MVVTTTPMPTATMTATAMTSTAMTAAAMAAAVTGTAAMEVSMESATTMEPAATAAEITAMRESATAVTATPAMPAEAAAPAKTVTPGIAAPVPAGSVPGIVVPAILVILPEELDQLGGDARIGPIDGVAMIHSVAQSRGHGFAGAMRERDHRNSSGSADQKVPHRSNPSSYLEIALARSTRSL